MQDNSSSQSPFGIDPPQHREFVLTQREKAGLQKSIRDWRASKGCEDIHTMYEMHYLFETAKERLRCLNKSQLRELYNNTGETPSILWATMQRFITSVDTDTTARSRAERFLDAYIDTIKSWAPKVPHTQVH